MDPTELEYDPSSLQSIYSYAKQFEGSTLREKCGIDFVESFSKRKGSLGDAIEQSYFGIENNSDPDADFKKVHTELKSTGLKKRRDGGYSAKERLVIQMINYMSVVDETWETSSLQKKLHKLLLVAYLYDKNLNPADYLIMLVELWSVPPEDIPVFKKDWETVVSKIRAGRAHELSGSDTFYLEACTKAASSKKTREQPFSNVPAKPRAWAIKSSYMTSAFGNMLHTQAIKREARDRELGLGELVRLRFSPYVGLTEEELASHFGLIKSDRRKPKDLCARITKHVLGIDQDAKIAEFEKAGIKTKTMRLKKNGEPKESISFPVFKYTDLAVRSFEESDFNSYLHEKYLFVIYREDPSNPNVYRMAEVLFWQMPDADLVEARACYEEMQRRVHAGHAERSVTSKENRCCHVRPHGRNKSDTLPTPYGSQETKKCFWLNARYIGSEIDRVRRDASLAVEYDGSNKDRDDVQKRMIRVAELFAGVGGFRLGLDGYRNPAIPGFEMPAAGPYQTVWANQWEPPGTPKRQFAAECYRIRFGEGSVVNQDINQVLDEYEEGRIDIPDVDMVVGGFPCQDYSVAKPLSQASGIEGKKGVLWWDIYRFLRLKEPRLVLLENVDRLLKSPAKQRGRDFAVILSCFASLGYAVEWRVVNAADYGFPQKRRRTYIYAEKTDEAWNLENRLGDGVMSEALPVMDGYAPSRFEVPLDPYECSEHFGLGLKASPFLNAGAVQAGVIVSAKMEPRYGGSYATLSDVMVSDGDVPKSFWVEEGEKLDRWRYYKGAKNERRVNRTTGHEYNYTEGAVPFPDPIDSPSRTILTSEGGGVGLPDDSCRSSLGRPLPPSGAGRARPAAGVSERLDEYRDVGEGPGVLHGKRARRRHRPPDRRGHRAAGGRSQK